MNRNVPLNALPLISFIGGQMTSETKRHYLVHFFTMIGVMWAPWNVNNGNSCLFVES